MFIFFTTGSAFVCHVKGCFSAKVFLGEITFDNSPNSYTRIPYRLLQVREEIRQYLQMLIHVTVIHRNCC